MRVPGCQNIADASLVLDRDKCKGLSVARIGGKPGAFVGSRRNDIELTRKPPQPQIQHSGQVRMGQLANDCHYLLFLSFISCYVYLPKPTGGERTRGRF